MARDIIGAVTEVALDDARKPALRALAISIFRGCFDLMDIVKDDHAREVREFASGLITKWNPFFMGILRTRLPEENADGQQPESWKPIIMLKLQVLKTLLKIKSVFAELLLEHSTVLFTAVWEELSLLHEPHRKLYIDDGVQGRLEDVDGLPYTLDFLILEELDLLNQLFRARPVQTELNMQLKAPGSTPWMAELMKMLVAYSRITCEEEGLWEVDCSLYLAEETSVTANYTARTAAGDLLIKLGEWFSQDTLDALFFYTGTMFEAGSWQDKEAALYLFSMLHGDFTDMDKEVDEKVAEGYMALVGYAINSTHKALLQARGFLVAGNLAKRLATPDGLVDRTIAMINPRGATDEMEVVQVACIKAIADFAAAGKVTKDRQIPTLQAISAYMQGKDPDDMEEADELLVTLSESIQAVIGVDFAVALSDEIRAMDMVLQVAKLGAANFQVTMLVGEAFTEIVSAMSAAGWYEAFCGKVLPTLTGAFDAANVTEEGPLVTVATELLEVLVEHGSEPLPGGFVAATFPRLYRILMESSEGEVLRPGAECVKYMLQRDHHQVFAWNDGKETTGLNACLLIIDRLLGTSIEDNAASEVGGLAAELVEKAGHDRLGPYLFELLRGVANRLVSADAAPFIQSLILVFVRLSIGGAGDVVEFLSQIGINGEPGLKVVMSKWLENSISFAGYDAIREK